MCYNGAQTNFVLSAHLPIWRDIDLDKLAVRTIVEKELGLLLERAGRHGK